jgi:hypothetical protein
MRQPPYSQPGRAGIADQCREAGHVVVALRRCGKMSGIDGLSLPGEWYFFGVYQATPAPRS